MPRAPLRTSSPALRRPIRALAHEPLLAQLGKMTGETEYFDDAAQQMIGMSARLFSTSNGPFDHSWFANMDDDARFYWGRPDGQIEDICVGTTAAYDAVYYYNRPTGLTAM